jgi:radical SAM protein with 4Fe4S-binding SPASM domain
MCGQWQAKRRKKNFHKRYALALSAWKKVIDEISHHEGSILLIRGGEPFLYPSIVDLLAFIKSKIIFVSIDSNGMLLEKYAEDIARLAIDNLVISVDGPEKIHNNVRGVTNSFKRIANGLEALHQAERKYNVTIPKVLCFVISPYSYRGLSQMPDVARQLNIGRIAIVPYYYFNRDTGAKYEKIMREEFQCSAFSWKGFHRQVSGIKIKEFIELLRSFKKNLHEVVREPFMDFSEKEYRAWFSNSNEKVNRHTCHNPWVLADIQPNGDVNFCVDFPDYIIGNIRYNSLQQIWNGGKADKFRNYLEKKSLPICFRCGAQYMSG